MLKIYVCCHQPSFVPESRILFPVQVGTALSESRFDGFLHDDTGINISALNRSYCELTAQYWAWKNEESDYYGFFHYRRYLYFSENKKKPYYLKKRPDSDFVNLTTGYQALEKQISAYDIIAPVGEDMHMSVRQHYANARFHNMADLELVQSIIQRQYPQYVPAMEMYLTNTKSYFGNIYIMKKNVFFRYCAWLFAILKEYDSQKDVSDYSTQELRVDGYLSERLFGVFLTFMRDWEGAAVLEVPRIHFECMTSSETDYRKKLLINALLPPGTRRRALIKRLKAF